MSALPVIQVSIPAPRVTPAPADNAGSGVGDSAKSGANGPTFAAVLTDAGTKPVKKPTPAKGAAGAQSGASLPTAGNAPPPAVPAPPETAMAAVLAAHAARAADGVAGNSAAAAEGAPLGCTTGSAGDGHAPAPAVGVPRVPAEPGFAAGPAAGGSAAVDTSAGAPIMPSASSAGASSQAVAGTPSAAFRSLVGLPGAPGATDVPAVSGAGHAEDSRDAVGAGGRGNAAAVNAVVTGGATDSGIGAAVLGAAAPPSATLAAATPAAVPAVGSSKAPAKVPSGTTVRLAPTAGTRVTGKNSGVTNAASGPGDDADDDALVAVPVSATSRSAGAAGTSADGSGAAVPAAGGTTAPGSAAVFLGAAADADSDDGIAGPAAVAGGAGIAATAPVKALAALQSVARASNAAAASGLSMGGDEAKRAPGSADLSAAGAGSADAAAGMAQLGANTAVSGPVELAPAAAPTLQVHAGVDSGDFPQSLSERVSWMVNNGINGAKLQVNPPQLGPIELRISVQGDHALVSMSSHSAVTRDALESSAPKLREMLGAQGFGQVSVDISQRSFQDRSAYSAPYERAATPGRAANAVGAPTAIGAPPRRSSQGALDAYA